MSVASYAVGRAPVAANLNPPYAPSTSDEAFDVFQTVISQYANSPIILALLASESATLDAAGRFDDFYKDIWNIDTATGYGLDLWGRILGITRVVNIPPSGTYIGFKGQTGGEPLSQGIWYHGADATSNVALTDAAYRRVLLAKAMANISNGSIPSLNAIVMFLFPSYGNSYVMNDGSMSLSYRFGATLSALDFALASQKNILPRPLGYIVNIVQP
jgi:hypothetical protein